MTDAQIYNLAIRAPIFVIKRLTWKNDRQAFDFLLDVLNYCLLLVRGLVSLKSIQNDFVHGLALATSAGCLLVWIEDKGLRA